MTRKIDVTDPYEHGITIPRTNSDPVHAINTEMWHELDWSHPELPDDVHDARATFATEIHYLYMSHLMMLGGVVQEEPDTDLKRLAAALSDDRMRNVDSWSRYMAMLRVDTQVTADMDEHVKDLMSEDSLCRLTSIIHGDVFIVTLYNHLEDNDSLLGRVLARDVEQAQQNIDMATDYLDAWQRRQSKDRCEDIATRIATCIRWVKVYADRYQDTMDAAGIDVESFMDAFSENTRIYYDRVTPDVQ